MLLPPYPQLPDPPAAATLRRCLLRWYRTAQRRLPWRSHRNPYRTWISEVMLQQTQVATVIPYYERFLQSFPDLASLAAATEQEVLKHWEGLGYYRRARDLHRAARIAVTSHNGQIPDDPMALRQWPGIGRYMVGAILSQAYDRSLPIVEANSARVLARLSGCRSVLRSSPVQQWLWLAAEALVPLRGAGEFNQALMELGALVCTPGQPSCAKCPLRKMCVAQCRGVQAQIPRSTRNPPIERLDEAACVIHRGSRVLLVQRQDMVRWGGLWEFPHGPISNGEAVSQAVSRIAHELTGLRLARMEPLFVLQHTITRFQITLNCYRADAARGRFSSAFCPDHAWIRLEDLANYPLSSPHRKIAKKLVTTHGPLA